MEYTALSTKDKIRFGNDVQTITTLEIAEMMELPHYEILKKLEGTTNPDGSVRQVGIIPTLGKGKIPVTDYFIKSTYTTSQNKEMPCYKVTKLGCDFLANKFNGEKGIIFTARYVKRFDEMERGQIPQDFPSALRAYADEVERSESDDDDGITYQIVDIGLRMLEPRELYGCQGFPDDYIIDHDYTGKIYPRSEQVRRCGNAVCPPIPAALVRANLPELCVAERMPNMQIEAEQTGQLRFA